MIYLDHHAGTPLGTGVRRAMQAAGEIGWANPSSAHAPGRAARAAVERAREKVADALGASPADLVLTSGGTEACNLGVFGLFGEEPGGHVVTTGVEHPAVAACIERLEASGARVTRLDVHRGRSPGPSDLVAALRADTRLVAVQAVNHETGTVLPIADLAVACGSVPMFVDASQALGKLTLDVRTFGASGVAVAAHKVGGPAGAAALWVDRTARFTPRSIGGGQERGRRAGTPDATAAAGFGAACTTVRDRLASMPAIGLRRDRLEAAAVALGGTRNAWEGPRVATATSLAFRGWRATALAAALDLEGVCVASGAACSSGLDRPSPVLLAMHPDEPWRAGSSLRFSLGPETTDDEIDRAVAALGRVLARPAT